MLHEIRFSQQFLGCVFEHDGQSLKHQGLTLIQP